MDKKENAIVQYHNLVSFMALTFAVDKDELIARLRRPAMTEHERVFREAAIKYLETDTLEE